MVISAGVWIVTARALTSTSFEYVVLLTARVLNPLRHLSLVARAKGRQR